MKADRMFKTASGTSSALHTRVSPRANQWTLLVLLAFAATGCGLGKKSTAIAEQSLTSSAGTGPSITAFSTTLYPYVRANCVSCHGSTQSPKFAAADVHSAYDAAITVVSFDHPELSTIVRKSADGHCGSACTTDGSAVKKLILDWKAASEAAGGSGGGEDIRVGNIFTAQIKVPPPNPMACPNPAALKCTSDGLDGGNPCTNVCWTKLKFRADQMTAASGLTNTALAAKVKRAWFEIDIAYENYASDAGPASYVLRNPRVVSADGPVYIFDVKTWLNGNYRPELGGAYQKIDVVADKALFGSDCSIPASPTAIDPNAIGAKCIPAAAPLFSTAASAAGILQEKTSLTDPDKVSFSFEYFQEGVAGECNALDDFYNKVYAPIQIEAVRCLACHKAAGEVSEAGMRFNMDLTDPVNGANPDARRKTVCRKFLQRSNLNYPDNSPIIVQPTQGLNGMPAQVNFDSFKGDWKSWIETEASLRH